LGLGQDIWEQVEAILGSGLKLALATTGGGSEVVSWLLNHPGASRAVVEAHIPYHEKALAEYLGFPGPHRAEESTAREMAGRARARAEKFAKGAPRIVGVGCTAALATDRVRRGADRAFVALRLEGEYRFLGLRFARGSAGRLEQEEVLSRLVLEAIAGACGARRESGWSLPDYCRVEERTLSLDDPLGLLVQGELELVEIGADGAVATEVERPGRLLFPGSFNPLHEGHAALAQAAQRLSGRKVCLEISVENVDKPPLSRQELERRLAQMRGRFPVVMSRAPVFHQKARLFANCHFAIGCDTLVRLLDGRYYEGGEQGMAEALDQLQGNGCFFWVGGRLHQGWFQTLADVEVPEKYREMFAGIPEEVFRIDLSSTEIRAQRKEERP
jgi:phosphopantetheine adenylyltransferase